MNLHEECLIKYLINPLDLFYATEALKANNIMLEKSLFNCNSQTSFLAKKPDVDYTYS